jgi:diguanylate cyclase (GGDEF)-like protein/PAS domain S-box-containing protein
MQEDITDVPVPGAQGGAGEFSPSRYEKLLRDAPERYSELVRHIGDYGIYMLDVDGRILSWNRGAENLTGYAEREVLTRPQSMLFPESAIGEGVLEKALNFARLNNHCREMQARRKRNGDAYLAQITLDAIRHDNGEIKGYVEVFYDVTAQKEREDMLYQRATRDALTGLFNRGHYTEMATQEIDRARRFAEPLSVILMDIDHFKKINDTYGHAVGDQAIIALAKTTTTFMRKIDFAGRIGGEEFAVLLPRANKEPALEVAQRLRLILAEQRIAVGEIEVGFTVSMGVAALRPTTRDLHELMRNADAALYKAKREGRNRVEAWFE